MRQQPYFRVSMYLTQFGLGLTIGLTGPSLHITLGPLNIGFGLEPVMPEFLFKDWP